ncbi:CGNR zinc finger domain-containing protein [Streptomyces misionensis]|uniref:CGNR zinc finger domain-containing protein n=1 Tax=Streptomyces misionensis TaxID=67331 RepID=UPI0033CC29AA
MHTDLASLAVSFANTLSSSSRDRIATLEKFRGWAQNWPTLQPLAARLNADHLEGVLERRNAMQAVMHAVADGRKPSAADLFLATDSGLAAAPFRLRSAPGGAALGRAPVYEAISHLLARSAVDLLLSPQAAELRLCEGVRCRKVFIAARTNRRWCDTRVCGNRARVAAHARRRSQDTESTTSDDLSG